MKRPNSTYHQLVQRIPADVAAKVRGLTLAIPVGDTVATIVVTPTRKDIRTSLRTRDPQEAKARQAVAMAYLEGVWESVRKGPKRLSHKETLALAGEIYQAWADAFEDDPGPSERWVRAEAANIQANAGRYGRASLMILSSEERRTRSVEERVGGFADAVLAKRGLVIDAASRARLNDELLKALRQATVLQLRRAEGDYSPDPQANRFPSFPETTGDTKAVSLLGLFDGWAKERKPSQSTVDQWRKHVQAFIAFMGKDDAGQVMKADVVRWKDALVDSGGSPKTINDSKLAALKAAYEWGVRNVRVASNPVTGVSVAHKKRAGEQMQGFTDAEAQAILSAAAKEGQPHLRWIPLLCAASGARVGEIAQLRAEDVIEQDGITAFRITAEAGSVKTLGSERTVPIHPAVIASGFLEYARGKQGPLFFDPTKRRTGAKKPQHKIVAKYVAEWVAQLGIASVGRANRKDPSHAWRHRFKTLARAAEINDSVADAIVGHAPDSVAKAYGTVTLATMRDAIERIPLRP
jgi:integrase